MTISAVQKAELDRGILLVDLTAVERKIASHSTTALTTSSVETYLERVSIIRASLVECHTRIVYQNPADLPAHETEYINFNERLTTATISLKDIQRSLTPAATSGAPPSTHVRIKLPEMKLPTFEGKYEDWPSFEDLFNANVGNVPNVTPSQKLQFLKQYVKGDAFSLIKSFIITDQNFIEAWQLLSNRYNNKSEIINALCKKILHQPQMKSESVQCLQQLLNTTMEAVRSLRVLGQPTDSWDSLLVVITVEKLDAETRSEWAKTRTSTTPPTFKELTDFLEIHIKCLTAKGVLTTKVSTVNVNNKPNNPSSSKARTYHVTAAPATCPMCKGSHQLYQCSKLLELEASQRMSAVKKTSACLNCLRDGHSVRSCTSTHTCKQCARKHHTLLHSNQPATTSSNGSNQSSLSSQDVVRTNIASSSTSSQRVFKTALVDIEDSTGHHRPCRVLFDDCSEAEYITESCATALGLPRTRANVRVEGVAGVTAAHCKSKVSALLQSRVYNENVHVENLFVIPRITGYIPRLPCDSKEWTHLNGLSLADPEYHVPGEIDILIGTGIVSYIMKNGIMHGTPQQPVAYNSIFGWVLSGIMNTQPTQVVRTHHTLCKLEEMVHRFWEVEQLPLKKPLTLQEEAAESHFIKTHTRKPDGRYVVRLPFNDKLDTIGETRQLAVQRLLQLERRFKRQPEAHQQYIQFMKEYLELGHMELVPESPTEKKKVFIPHHYVKKEDSTTTKLRVVFDASMKSTSGVSLNDTLLVGPTIQDELFTQLLRFRTHQVALKADVAKMYRQFEVHDDDRNYQVILWRESSEQPIREYRLKTVTYGTACAPFLATRCLVQLANDEEERYPKAAAAVKNTMYIDDLLGGTPSKEEAIALFNDLTKLCKAGGLDIRKWCSSNEEVLGIIPHDLQEQVLVHEFDEDTTVKALGIRWRPQGDYFYFDVERKEAKKVITKREILSEIARTYDPIGWLTPTTVVAKILFQDLWKQTSDWDAHVSEEIRQRWNSYCEELKEIETIKIPRVIIPAKPVDIQIHCYSDSSEKAMACALYLRSSLPNGEVTTHLITSRTRIAPLKALSIPRLELNAAVLLVETFDSVVKSFKFQYTVHAWTDSMITLCWLTSPSRKWKTYVATRIATIQEIIPARCWNHVRSSDNPADLPSRGVSPQELVKSTLWWNGPPWLSSHQFPTSQQQVDEDEVSKEERAMKTLIISTTSNSADRLFYSSSLSKVISTTAWLIRFIQFLRKKNECAVGPLTAVERKSALNAVIRYVQSLCFKEEIDHLKIKKEVNGKSRLHQLSPFIESNGIVRVGGRIGNSSLCSSMKHPIILPSQHHLTTLIIRECHEVTLHGGFNLTLSMLRRKYWILRGRTTVRNIVRKCVTCKRVKATQCQQLMGTLPASRVQQSRPFAISGVDFAGPFPVKMRKGRGSQAEKVYMAVFVCFSTKAVHLEVVTSLSSQDFIACYRRFVSRRGIPSRIHSDCGTNFVGADKELKKMLNEINADLQQQLSIHGTSWVFNPPSAPHQGGLWEAAVKSAKHHLKRIVGSHILTFEQLFKLPQVLKAKLSQSTNSLRLHFEH